MPETALILVAACVGILIGLVILFIILLIWHYRTIRMRPDLSPKQGKQEGRSYELLDRHERNDVESFQFENRLPTMDTEDSENESEPGDTCTCILDLEPVKKDDLGMVVGDLITITMTFTDGMAHGINRTTNQRGMFPIKHLIFENDYREDSYFEDTPVSMDFPPLARKGTAKLLFSTIPPEQAIEMINCLEPERKMEYFEQLLQSPTASTDGLPTPLTRAQKNWSRLRRGWKDAVKAELQTSFDAWETKRNHHAFWRLLVENYRIE